MRLLAGDMKPNPWASRFGWDRGLISRVFAGKQLPGPEALAKLAQAERVNLTWLLTGAGAPYQVLPPPAPDVIATGPEWHYYLFAGHEGVQPPLVRVGPEMRVTVYDGSPSDLLRAVDYLAWKGQPIYIAPDSGSVAGLRLGLVGNRALIDEGRGSLEGDLTAIDPAMWRAPPRLENQQPAHLMGPDQAAADPHERDWLMLLRELSEDRREAVLTLARWLAGQ